MRLRPILVLVRPQSIFVDMAVVTLIGAIFYGIVQVAHHWGAPLQSEVTINLSLWALPGYTALSLLRGMIAYLLSLAFTFVYGYIAARFAQAERVMIPMLDILQSIPVLGFLPGVVLTLVALFPHTNVGLELACIVMIFTGQVWNMTFSFYQSLRTIPEDLKEASSIYQFNWLQRATRMELPAASASLAWNSMMAVAGGWFFLMVCEAFSVGTFRFRLPGLGSYMSVAVAEQNHVAIVGGIVAMILMIVAVNGLLWRPLLVWTQKFRIEERESADFSNSWVLEFLNRSLVIQRVAKKVFRPLGSWFTSLELGQPLKKIPTGRLPAFFIYGLAILAALSGIWAIVWLVHLLKNLSLVGWLQVIGGTGLTFLRVLATVVIGSLWTIPVGLWIGRSEKIRRRFQPIVQVAASFPAPMLYPLVLLLLDRMGVKIGWGSIVLMLLGTQWYILFNVIAGASAIPPDLAEASNAYQFSPGQRWRTLWLPSLFPYLMTGWVTAAGGAWNASIVAEHLLVGSRLYFTRGVGSLISIAASEGRYDLLAAGVLSLSLLVVLINRYIWKPLYRLSETRYSLP